MRSRSVCGLGFRGLESSSRLEIEISLLIEGLFSSSFPTHTKLR
ncbi:hypothetical protein HPHPP25_1831 [Helicobacter pylori Hp P-25]|nr:hypothetical protein HPHPP25_1831 [Helicobacter pylori Hp P-25]EJC33428.1 hypothetical protein HPHPP25C_1549 [Helicobacter pylori Hp P-25c]EJC35410.1 hypothetical protein HPHPP25D_1682 [Helicobacter pylori Hp P-25d]